MRFRKYQKAEENGCWTNFRLRREERVEQRTTNYGKMITMLLI